MVRLCCCVVAAVLVVFGLTALADAAERPNVIIIYCDDLGWGDLGCYGHETFQTPSIDRLADEGALLTNFQSVCPFCAPSRAALQTGRYQFRHGLVENPAPDGAPEADRLGLPDSELTLGELFKRGGYRTSCIGKWHLGHQPEFLPLKHGYDEYFGIPYSNDMVPVKIYEDNLATTTLVPQTTLTRQYTEHALKFIEANRRKPFFLYLAHSMPHKPLAASEKFYRKSGHGLYADVMAELDWSVSQILSKLDDLELDDRTLVIFSSDNGPWYGGSTGGLRGMKGQAWEGGVRVPLLARWPGTIPAGVESDEPAMICDIFTTVLKAVGIPLPTDREIDGRDIMPMFKDRKAPSPHEAIYVMSGPRLTSVRAGRWKLMSPLAGPRVQKAAQAGEAYRDPRAPDGFRIIAPREQYRPTEFPGVLTGTSEAGFLLFDLDNDPQEQVNVAEKYPEEFKRLKALFKNQLAAMPEKYRTASQPPDPSAEAEAAPDGESADEAAKKKSRSKLMNRANSDDKANQPAAEKSAPSKKPATGKATPSKP